ncbi:MAG: gas vesicle protein K [Candidatus Thermoplasmatota archaeon]|nr:gas vesicle protein K [Candidatus Thermoplasmatota archaeon]
MTVNIDEKNLKPGLLGLVVALVEIIQETLERQALRRMEGGRLNEEEIERLGNALMELNEALEHIKKENGIEDVVGAIRNDLDRVTDEAVGKIINPERWKEETAKVDKAGMI